jgi:hypothetical protein
MAKREPKTYRYTITFTIETSRKLNTEELEEKVAAVWDSGNERESGPFIADSYGFMAATEDEIPC